MVEDRGDVAPPAGKMPRSEGDQDIQGSIPAGVPDQMGSRCEKCGSPLTVRDVPHPEVCAFCNPELSTPHHESEDHPINPNDIHPPKGSAPAPGKSIGAIHASADHKTDASTQDMLNAIDAELADAGAAVDFTKKAALDEGTEATLDSIDAELADVSIQKDIQA